MRAKESQKNRWAPHRYQFNTPCFTQKKKLSQISTILDTKKIGVRLDRRAALEITLSHDWPFKKLRFTNQKASFPAVNVVGTRDIKPALRHDFNCADNHVCRIQSECVENGTCTSLITTRIKESKLHFALPSTSRIAVPWGRVSIIPLPDLPAAFDNIDFKSALSYRSLFSKYLAQPFNG